MHTDAQPFDPSAPRKPTNVTVNTDLLRQAREAGVNLSQTLEVALSAKVVEARRARWLAENQAAIAAYNAHVERDGVFSAGRRRF
jgi:antitoxin CcdA